MKTLCLFLTLMSLLPTLTWACIPSTGLVLDRTTDKHGRGSYNITQDLQFLSAEGSLRIREKWWIKDGDELRLEVTGLDENTKDLKLTFIYKGAQKFKSSQAAAERINTPMAESFFHVRSPGQLLQMTKAIGAIASDVQLTKAPVKNVEDLQLKCNPHARLSRIDGTVAYAFGALSRSGDDRAPGLWIEQDQFVIRKLRMKSLAEVTASDYSSYSRNLFFPKKRLFRWGASQSEARLISIRPISNSEINLNVKSLQEELVWPSDQRVASLLKDFYSRFR